MDSPEWIEVHKDNLIAPVTIGGDGRILEFEDIRHLIDPWHYGGYQRLTEEKAISKSQTPARKAQSRKKKEARRPEVVRAPPTRRSNRLLNKQFHSGTVRVIKPTPTEDMFYNILRAGFY